MSSTLPLFNISVNSFAVVDATIDATDTGYAWGYQDATEGKQQCGSAYFPMGTPAWAAYNEGYKTGCLHAEVFTGVKRFYVEFPSDAPPAITMPSAFPWETAEEVTRQQIEDEIHGDAEYAEWLDGLFADEPAIDDTDSMGELAFMEHTFAQLAAKPTPKTLIFTDETLSAIEDEHIGLDFCRQPFLY